MGFPNELIAWAARHSEDIRDIKSFRLCSATAAKAGLKGLVRETLLFPTHESYQRALAIAQDPRTSSLVTAILIFPSILGDKFVNRDQYRLLLLKQAGHKDAAAATLLSWYQHQDTLPSQVVVPSKAEHPYHGATFDRIHRLYSIYYARQQYINSGPMPLLRYLLDHLPKLDSLRLSSMVEFSCPPVLHPLPGSSVDVFAKTNFPIRGPMAAFSARNFTPMLFTHLIDTNKAITTFHNIHTAATIPVDSVDSAVVFAIHLELYIDHPLFVSPGIAYNYVPLATATALISLSLHIDKRNAGNAVAVVANQMFRACTWPVLHTFVLSGPLLKSPTFHSWFERHAHVLRKLEISDVSLLGVETFDDVFDGLVGGGLERLVVRSICRRSRGTQAMHAYDTYPPVLVPWELDEVGRRVLRFLAGGRWKGVTRTGWLRLDEADEEEDDVVEEEEDDDDDDEEGADDKGDKQKTWYGEVEI